MVVAAYLQLVCPFDFALLRSAGHAAVHGLSRLQQPLFARGASAGTERHCTSRRVGNLAAMQNECNAVDSSAAPGSQVHTETKPQN